MTVDYRRPAFVDSLWKEPKGEHRRERVEKRINVENAEEKAKREAKKLDGHACRWPHKRGEKQVCQRLRLESAHYKAKSRGGENDPKNLITFDLDVHQGPRSLHSGHKRVVPIDPKLRMRGPCIFEERATLRSPWVEVGRELSVGLLEKA